MVETKDIIVDFRGSITSITLLKMTQVFERMAPFEIMEVRGCDPDTRRDLFKVLPAFSYEVLPVDGVEEDGVCRQVRIRKRP